MSDETRAFELRDDVDPELFGGSVTLQSGIAWDVREALDDGDGVIVSADPALIHALDNYPALKRVGVPEGAVVVETIPFEKQTVPDLQAEINRRNSERADVDDQIVVEPPANKPELVAALEADDAKINAENEGN